MIAWILKKILGSTSRCIASQATSRLTLHIRRSRRIVMTAAAKNLTPVVLELGGKNPTIVHSSANLKVAARRIAFGRWVNCGQSCTAPDYVLVFKDVAAEFTTGSGKSLQSPS